MHCPHCGKEHPSGAQFCPTIGKMLDKPQVCNNCGGQLPSTALKFCPRCGYPIGVHPTTKRKINPIPIVAGVFGIILITAIVIFYVFYLRKSPEADSLITENSDFSSDYQTSLASEDGKWNVYIYLDRLLFVQTGSEPFALDAYLLIEQLFGSQQQGNIRILPIRWVETSSPVGYILYIAFIDESIPDTDGQTMGIWGLEFGGDSVNMTSLLSTPITAWESSVDSSRIAIITCNGQTSLLQIFNFLNQNWIFDQEIGICTDSAQLTWSPQADQLIVILIDQIQDAFSSQLLLVNLLTNQIITLLENIERALDTVVWSGGDRIEISAGGLQLGWIVPSEQNFFSSENEPDDEHTQAALGMAATQPPSPTTPLLPTETNVPSSTPEPQPSATPTPVEIATPDQINPKDNAGLMFIPAGNFIMGSDPQDDPYYYGAEGPSHEVYLDEYYIYQTEVTNAMYALCVSEQACPRPNSNISETRTDYYGNPRFDNYPVVNVTWIHAASYCRWAGGRLPTEAEWEKAARGTDGRLFPWGNDPSVSNRAQANTSDTAPIGSFPDGASPYGLLDMSGNVIEWVQDYFQSMYYTSSPSENPPGPATGSTRTYRGGSYHNSAEAIRTVTRGSRSESHFGVDIGFRCALDVEK